MATIYVSPQGDNAATGLRPKPGRGDGPVATLARAVELARASGTPRRRIVVGPGRYFDTGVTLVAADSGLEIVAATGARPEIYGGIEVRNWREEGGGSPFWVAEMPGVREGAVDFRALVVNGWFAPHARYPATGKLDHANEFSGRWMSMAKGGWDRKPTPDELVTMKLAPDSLPAGLSVRNAELTIFHCWDESRVGIHEWDRERGVIKFSTPASYPAGAFGVQKFVVWNTREGMTQPGQWYLDRERGLLVYWPMAEDRLTETAALVPMRTAVVRLVGTSEAPVRDVRLKGLTVGVTTTPLRAGGFGALSFEGAIEGEYAHGLRLEDVTVHWAGGQGIRVANSDGVRCRNCTVHTVGACGAVFTGSHGEVAGTLIHHNGRIYPSAMGLRLRGTDWRAHHNTLHHTPYTAIYANGNRVRVEHNRLHHAMEELLDGAAIYISEARDCAMRGNYTYDVPDAQVHAYYLDELCQDTVVEGNVATGVAWPIHNHMAWQCVIRDNICLYDGTTLRVSFVRCDGFRLERNVFACRGEVSVETSYTGVARMRQNVFSSGSGGYRWVFHDQLPSHERNVMPVPALPADRGSVIADPGCRCVDGRVTYENTELADQLGLQALDVSGAGCGRE